MNNKQKKVIKKFQLEELEQRYEMAWISHNPEPDPSMPDIGLTV